MRLYEEVFIVKPDVSDEETTAVVEQVSKIITDQGGTVDKIDHWGKRRLAYRVAKYDEGTFVILTFSAQADTVKELERRLRVNDLVIKFMTVRLDEKLKWVEKRKKKREERAKRKPPPVVPAPAAPAAPAAVIPGAPASPMPAAPVPENPASEAEVPVVESAPAAEAVVAAEVPAAESTEAPVTAEAPATESTETGKEN